jgi:hypothetical protein
MLAQPHRRFVVRHATITRRYRIAHPCSTDRYPRKGQQKFPLSPDAVHPRIKEATRRVILTNREQPTREPAFHRYMVNAGTGQIKALPSASPNQRKRITVKRKVQRDCRRRE